MKTPEVWTMREEEVSNGVYRITATTPEGQRIEATGTDEERLKEDVLRAIATLDDQIAKGRMQ